ncbi:unknown protein [Xanthomonas oryzae pv. oryzae KACC 10331]|uniref:Uncharacterized protein n=1 Tax=Xanthomonas oryzae pv. oryzae (strain KACC10331 / KXO85) TaxID=291331 RepID=Q5H6Z5_XANOR|nr:unknown protein [Xanthomonas oryzae pv. oryzae KACC 10331]
MCRVLGQSAIADLGVAEPALDHPEWMLHLRAHAGFDVFPTLFPSTLAVVADGLDRRGPGGEEGCCFAVPQFVAFFCAGIAAVAEHAVFFAMQQGVRHRDIGDIGCCAMDMVRPHGKRIHADVRLHPEIPLIALPGLMHLSVARVMGVLGRTGRSDQSRIDNRAGPQALALARQMRVDRFQHPCGKAMGLQQAANVENRGLVGNVVQAAELGKTPQCRYLVQRFFHCRIAQRIPLLQQMNPPHRRQGVWLPPWPPRHRRVRRDQHAQLLPGNHLLHLGQENLAPGLLALDRALSVTERQLHRGGQCRVSVGRCSELP